VLRTTSAWPLAKRINQDTSIAKFSIMSKIFFYIANIFNIRNVIPYAKLILANSDRP